MNCLISLKRRLTPGIGFVVIALVVSALFLPVVYAGGDGKPEKSDSTEKQKLTGQDLYSINCNRCHSERYPKEFTSAHWKTIMMHMRTRANLPASQARRILKYLQEESGN